MSDVAAASGSANNVYAVLTQYADSAGPAAYAQSFGSRQDDPKGHSKLWLRKRLSR